MVAAAVHFGIPCTNEMPASLVYYARGRMGRAPTNQGGAPAGGVESATGYQWTDMLPCGETRTTRAGMLPPGEYPACTSWPREGRASGKPATRRALEVATGGRSLTDERHRASDERHRASKPAPAAVREHVHPRCFQGVHESAGLRLAARPQPWPRTQPAALLEARRVHTVRAGPAHIEDVVEPHGHQSDRRPPRPKGRRQGISADQSGPGQHGHPYVVARGFVVYRHFARRHSEPLVEHLPLVRYGDALLRGGQPRPGRPSAHWPGPDVAGACRRREARQHGQSAPLAVWEVGSCASSGHAWRL